MNKLIRLAAVASACATAALPALAAPVQWTVASGGNDHWYEFVQTPAYWSDAQASALGSSWMGMSGYLVTITSAAENAFIASLPGFAAVEYAWIGGSDAADEGQWRWVGGPETGQLFGYTNWAPGEPNNASGNEDYAHVQPPVANPGWNDLQDQAYLGYIVEYSVPEPGSLSLGLLALGALGLRARGRRSTSRPTG